jgi:hypothetical protein
MKKLGFIIEGQYHYDLVNVNIDNKDILPYSPRWLEGVPERFSALKTPESLTKGLKIIKKRHHHPTPINFSTPIPMHVALKIAHDTLLKDGFYISPLQIKNCEKDVDMEYINMIRISLPWKEIYELTEKMEKKISCITAEYFLINSKKISISIHISMPIEKRRTILGISTCKNPPIICKSAEDFLAKINGTRYPLRAIEI